MCVISLYWKTTRIHSWSCNHHWPNYKYIFKQNFHIVDTVFDSLPIMYCNIAFNGTDSEAGSLANAYITPLIELASRRTDACGIFGNIRRRCNRRNITCNVCWRQNMANSFRRLERSTNIDNPVATPAIRGIKAGAGGGWWWRLLRRQNVLLGSIMPMARYVVDLLTFLTRLQISLAGLKRMLKLCILQRWVLANAF